jgi:hypothetical protein
MKLDLSDVTLSVKCNVVCEENVEAKVTKQLHRHNHSIETLATRPRPRSTNLEQ